MFQFEWDYDKAAANLRAHGVSFELAQTAFEDTFAIDRVDDRKDYGEERFVLTGTAKNGALLYVAYTERDDRVRIISARNVTPQEHHKYHEQNA